ncbi:MAG: hypothetical protein COV45_06705 [Deltaproteobacteria bacterium CG11_big_fil_rev_8_21_14_0_20_47_16]|nr:MAG: hypothetical protein COV45_06705 [Deltaproteobacteria bacterium CG11_big_fil_rev_8_21_14_0_20_47_16]
MSFNKSQRLFVILVAFLITNAVVAEVVSPKSFSIFGRVMSSGVIMWPFVFIMTDLINEYFGKKSVRFATYVAMSMIAYLFFIVTVTTQIPAEPSSWINDLMFNRVFGSSLWIIAGSITAFLLSQLIDVTVFHAIRKRTRHRFLWLRATGSTIVSQLVDSFVVLFISYYLSGFKPFGETMAMAFNEYIYKFLIAVAVTPLVYLGHYAIDRYLGPELSLHLQQHSDKSRIPPDGPPIA